jgi:hypothetical protein
MSLLDFLGAGKSISDAQKATTQIVEQLAPLLQDAENRLGGIGESLLDRVDGATITIPQIVITLKLKPIPKATAVG